MKQPVKIFLCYAKEDELRVKELYQKLKDANFTPWMDKFDLVGGEEWQSAIQKTIRDSDFFVACLSKHWIYTNPQDRKRFFRREIQTALDVLPELQQGDIWIIPIRFEACDVPDRLKNYQWIDYFEKDGWDRLIRAIDAGMSRLRYIKPIKLRSQPLQNLSEDDVKKMLQEKGFAELYKNRFGQGLQHQYEQIERSDILLIVDHATGLTWQQSGSQEQLTYADAEKYVRGLNDQKFAGYNDWRLPTLEEAMSLMESENKSGGLYIDPMFDNTQRWIWTIDKNAAGSAVWFVYFRLGQCQIEPMLFKKTNVRAVRSNN